MGEQANRASIVGPPSEMARLADGERLLIRALRHWIAGAQPGSGRQRRLVERAMLDRFGAADAQVALAGLARLVEIVCVDAVGRLSYHPPCCPCAHPDELRLIGPVAAARAGRPEIAYWRACSLVSAEAAGDLVTVAESLAAIFSAHGFALPLRPGPADGPGIPRPPGLAGTTLH